MTETQSKFGGINRRTFIKGAGVATGVAATGASTSRLDLAPVQDVEAVPPIVIGAGIAAGGVAIGWALREFEVVGADDPPEGLTADALRQDVWETARTRASTNASTIVDNRNILDGVKNTAYVEGKLAAIEALNAGKSQSDVQTAATSAVETYHTTIKTNFLKSWNETVLEVDNLWQRLDSHPDTNSGSEAVLTPKNDQYEGEYRELKTDTHTLPDGTTMDLHYIYYGQLGAAGNYKITGADHGNVRINVDSPDGGDVDYLEFNIWNGILTEMDTIFNDVSDGLITWVDAVYGQVQTGEISIKDLITPRERAAMMTDDGKYPQAVADLLALNVPVDFEREAHVTLTSPSGDLTLKGSLAISSPPDQLTPGTYDPEADGLGSVYLTYDVTQGEGVYGNYDADKGVDGGTVEFEAEPPAEVQFHLETNYGETATFTTSDLTEGTDGSGNTVWTVDISDQLDNSIAEIKSVTFTSKSDETRYETVQLKDTFTIDKFVNTETGEEETEANFESSDPQDDTNYVTQEEWDQLQQQNQELIEEYEDSQSGGGGGWFGGGGDGGSLGIIALGVAAIGAIFALGQSNN